MSITRVASSLGFTSMSSSSGPGMASSLRRKASPQISSQSPLRGVGLARRKASHQRYAGRAPSATSWNASVRVARSVSSPTRRSRLPSRSGVSSGDRSQAGRPLRRLALWYCPFPFATCSASGGTGPPVRASGMSSSTLALREPISVSRSSTRFSLPLTSARSLANSLATTALTSMVRVAMSRGLTSMCFTMLNTSGRFGAQATSEAGVDSSFSRNASPRASSHLCSPGRPPGAGGLASKYAIHQLYSDRLVSIR
mmetsp:Transcript_31091/g.79829  ORF Transcript_31091/g.79829 Transcript_31091/m.79829 type:complete len:255 (+) Transcript_31091:266-1030(+)